MRSFAPGGSQTLFSSSQSFSPGLHDSMLFMVLCSSLTKPCPTQSLLPAFLLIFFPLPESHSSSSSPHFPPSSFVIHSFIHFPYLHYHTYIRTYFHTSIYSFI